MFGCGTFLPVWLRNFSDFCFCSYYNERVLLLLESIGRKCGSLRGDVVCCFVALGMDNEFVRQMICACLMQSDDLQLQARCLMFCCESDF